MPSNLFTVVLGVMPQKGSMIRYAFVANLSERKIRQAIAGDGTSSSVMYIVDKDHRFLSHPDSKRFGSTVEKGDHLQEMLEIIITDGNALSYRYLKDPSLLSEARGLARYFLNRLPE